MTNSVERWEDLPAGEWLETDESGTNWYLDTEGNTWYSDSNGYHIYQSHEEESIPPHHSEEKGDTSIESGTSPKVTKSFPLKLSVGTVFLLIVGSIIGYMVYDNATEPVFYDEIYWSDSGRGFSFGTDEALIVFPSNNGECEEWSDEYQTFEQEKNVCVAEMQISEYKMNFKGGDVYEMCIEDSFEIYSCDEIHVFSDGIVMKESPDSGAGDDQCRIYLNNIETPNIDSQSLHIYSQVIMNGMVRFDIDDSWTTEFLQASREVYNEAKSLDCYFVQFEYMGPRLIFDVRDHSEGLTDAVNDSLGIVTVDQAEYTTPYQDIEVYVFTENGQFECDVIEMIETESGWERSSISEADCVSELYNIDSGNDLLLSLSVGDQLVLMENNQQICDGPCDLTYEILHFGEIKSTGMVQFE